MHNRRNQVAAKPRPPRARTSLAPAFPADVAIPPPLGASSKTITLPARVAAQPLFAMPEREPQERLRTPIKPKRRKAPARRRKAAGKARKARAPRPDPATALAAFALPRQDEPLVEATPSPPPSRALAPARSSGMLAQIGQWLGQRAEAIWARLGSPTQGSSAELRQLRAENARLRSQLDALLALQQSKSPRARERAPLPFP